jgi:hypothetical protein
MKSIIFTITLIMGLLTSCCIAQVYSQKDIVNQYDPFTITFNDLVLNTNDEDFREHAYVIIATITAGSEEVIKIINKEDLTINSVKNYDDVFWNINFSVKKNNIILMPSLINLTSNPTSIKIKLQGYSNIYEPDQVTLNQLSSSFCYTSSGIYNLMDYAFKFLSNSPDINRPNNNLLTTADVLAQNISKRPEIFYLGNPTEIEYVIPKDPGKVIGTNILIQGPRAIQSKASTSVSDIWNLTITKLTDVKLVQNQPYYVKIKGVFSDLTNQQVITSDHEYGYLEKAQDVIDNDLILGNRTDVYINDQVARQFTNLMNLIKAGVRVKSDTAYSTNDLMKSDEREALSYFETNLKENDFNIDNEYLYDDYINVNRGVIQREIDMIRRYYEIK